MKKIILVLLTLLISACGDPNYSPTSAETPTAQPSAPYSPPYGYEVYSSVRIVEDVGGETGSFKVYSAVRVEPPWAARPPRNQQNDWLLTQGN